MNEKDYAEYIDHIPKVKDEYECIDLECSHYDGDRCTLGGCFDPPEEVTVSTCGD